MTERYWLVSDGRAVVCPHTVPAGLAFRAIIWDGETALTLPAGTKAEHENVGKQNGRKWWTGPGSAAS